MSRYNRADMAAKWAAQSARQSMRDGDQAFAASARERFTGTACREREQNHAVPSDQRAGRMPDQPNGVLVADRCPTRTQPRPPKYSNIKTDGYASKKEAKRAFDLKLMQEAGQIRNLREQVQYVLIPRQLDRDGSVAERACSYIADFVYEAFPDWREIVEDAKGMRTRDYIIKRKLMRFTHGIAVREV